MLFKRENYTMENGKLRAYAWPGGYPLYYLTEDQGILCSDCANLPESRNTTDPDCPEDRQWLVVAVYVNWEDNALYCDHCSKQIEFAYGGDGHNDTN